jgi:hypothetical protein
MTEKQSQIKAGIDAGTITLEFEVQRIDATTARRAARLESRRGLSSLREVCRSFAESANDQRRGFNRNTAWNSDLAAIATGKQWPRDHGRSLRVDLVTRQAGPAYRFSTYADEARAFLERVPGSRPSPTTRGSSSTLASPGGTPPAQGSRAGLRRHASVRRSGDQFLHRRRLPLRHADPQPRPDQSHPRRSQLHMYALVRDHIHRPLHVPLHDHRGLRRRDADRESHQGWSLGPHPRLNPIKTR